MHSIKQQLYDLCRIYVDDRKEAIEKIIAETREASGNETKSSAGDKYETGREMLQQEINMNGARLSELLKLKAALDLINPAHQSPVIIPGSLVETNQGCYYIAISAGKLSINNANYFAISLASPLGMKLSGKHKGDDFQFNGKQIVILDVS